MAETDLGRSVLVLLDGSPESEEALRLAVRLATHAGGEVSALRVLEPPRSHFFATEARNRQEQFIAELQAEVETELATLVENANTAEVAVTGTVLLGRPYQEAIREVLRHQRDLLIVGAPAASAERVPTLDSEELHLLRKCPCPVWVDRRGGAPVEEVMVAVDLEPAEEELPLLSAKLMRLALAVARAENATLHVVHAWSLYREESTRLLAGEAADWLTREAAARHNLRLRAFLQEAAEGESQFEVHLENGDAEDVIPTLLQRHGIDLLVLGSVTRSRIPGLLMGSTAERLIHRVGCSLLATKPNDFETAVTLDN